jgi:hypothetical protein
VIDNLRAAVVRADWFDRDLADKVRNLILPAIPWIFPATAPATMLTAPAPHWSICPTRQPKPCSIPWPSL